MVTKSAKSLPMEDVVWPRGKNSCDLGPSLCLSFPTLQPELPGLYMMKLSLTTEAADQKDVKPFEESRRQLEGVGWQEGPVTCEIG